jgi:hypothetical protein
LGKGHKEAYAALTDLSSDLLGKFPDAPRYEDEVTWIIGRESLVDGVAIALERSRDAGNQILVKFIP